MSERTSRRGDTTRREAVGPTVDRAMVQCATSPTRREGGEGANARTYARMYVRESVHATCIARQVVRVRGHESVRVLKCELRVGRVATRERREREIKRGGEGERERICVCISSCLKSIYKTGV